jgi:hypothetical protein
LDAVPGYRFTARSEPPMTTSWIIELISIASMPATYDMARERGRSPRAWLYVALIIGPLALLALLVLGKRDSKAKHPAPVN